MQPEALKLLVDIQNALRDRRRFYCGMDFGMYRIDTMCRAAVERKFEVIGEACTRIRDRYPDLLLDIDSASQIIGFRNRLIHGYDNVDDAIVWDVVTLKLPKLKHQIDALME